MKLTAKHNKVRVLGNICEKLVLDDLNTHKSSVALTDEEHDGVEVIKMESDVTEETKKKDVNINCNASDTKFKQNERLNLQFTFTDRKTRKPIPNVKVKVYYDAGSKYNPNLELIHEGTTNQGLLTFSYIEESLNDYEIVVEIVDEVMKGRERFTIHIIPELILYFKDVDYTYVYEFYEEDELVNIKNKVTPCVTASFNLKTGGTKNVFPDKNGNYVIDKNDALDSRFTFTYNRDEYYYDNALIKLDNANYFVKYGGGKDDETVDGRTKATAFKTLPYCLNKLDSDYNTVSVVEFPPETECKLQEPVVINYNVFVLGNPKSEACYEAKNNKWFIVKPNKYIVLRNFGFTDSDGEDYYFNTLTINNLTETGTDLVVDLEYIKEAHASRKQPDTDPTPADKTDKIIPNLDCNVDSIVFKQNTTGQLVATLINTFNQQPISGAKIRFKTETTDETVFTNKDGVAKIDYEFKNINKEVLLISAEINGKVMIKDEKHEIKTLKKIYVFSNQDEDYYYYHICIYDSKGEEKHAPCSVVCLNDKINFKEQRIDEYNEFIVLKTNLRSIEDISLKYDENEYYWNGEFNEDDSKEIVLIKNNVSQGFFLQNQKSTWYFKIVNFITNEPLKNIKCVFQGKTGNITKNTDENGEISIESLNKEPDDGVIKIECYKNDKKLKTAVYNVKIAKKVFVKVEKIQYKEEAYYKYTINGKKNDLKDDYILPDNSLNITYLNSQNEKEPVHFSPLDNEKGVFRIVVDNLLNGDYQNIKINSVVQNMYYFDYVFEYKDWITPDDKSDDSKIQEDIQTNKGDKTKEDRKYLMASDFIDEAEGVLNYLKTKRTHPNTVTVKKKELSFASYLLGCIDTFYILQKGSSTEYKISVKKTRYKDSKEYVATKWSYKQLSRYLHVTIPNYIKDYSTFPRYLKFGNGRLGTYYYARLIIYQLVYYKEKGKLPDETRIIK